MTIPNNGNFLKLLAVFDRNLKNDLFLSAYSQLLNLKSIYL